MIKAKYTVVLKTLLDDPTTKAEIDKALSKYPLYEPQKEYDIIPNRSELNQRLLNEYKYREIGSETVAQFIDWLETTMCEIMPRYNELYKTCETMAELPSPFDNVDVIEKITDIRTGTTSSNNKTGSETNASDTSETNSETTSHNKAVKTSTPQGVTNIPAENIDTVNVADEVNWNKNKSNDKANTSGTSQASSSSTSEGISQNSETYEHTYTKTGNQGVNTYAHDMNEFRTSIIDVTNQIITDKRIKDLFFKVY